MLYIVLYFINTLESQYEFHMFDMMIKMVPQYILLFFFVVAFTAVEYILKIFDNHIYHFYQWQEHKIR